MCVYFLVCIICSLKPFRSGLLGAGSWYSSPVTSYLIHPQVFKSPYPSVQTLLICSMILNDTARKYLPQGALRGFGKYCPPATTLGPEPSTAFGPSTRTCFRKAILAEDGIAMKEKEEEEKERRKEERKEATAVTDLKHSPPPPPSLSLTRDSFRGSEGPHSPLIYMHLQWGTGKALEGTCRLPFSEAFSWEKILSA